MNEIIAECRHGLAQRLLLNCEAKITICFSRNPPAIGFPALCSFYEQHLGFVFSWVQKRVSFQSVFWVDWLEGCVGHCCRKSTNFQVD